MTGELIGLVITAALIYPICYCVVRVAFWLEFGRNRKRDVEAVLNDTYHLKK